MPTNHGWRWIAQLDAQNKALADQVGKLNLALGDFKQALGSLGEKVIHQEQATKRSQFPSTRTPL